MSSCIRKVGRITKEQIREAVAGWNAYTSTNPIEIETWITTTNGSLPFLKKAFRNSFDLFSVFAKWTQ